MPWDRAPFPENPLKELDRFRSELGTDYVDSLLIHCATKHTWPVDLRRFQDAFSEAQSKGHIRIKGVSCHGLPALTAATTNDWVDVHLARVNAQAHHMDGTDGTFGEPGNRDAAMKELARDARARPRRHRHEARSATATSPTRPIARRRCASS